jgi:hypothetical protein
MNPQIKNLKSDKITFTVLIGIMLLSLIYISGYSILMKDKMESFEKQMHTIHQEMKILLEFIPSKDSVINLQKQQIFSQIQEIQKELTRNQSSEEDKEKLLNRMRQLKQQVDLLKVQAKQTIQENPVTDSKPNIQIVEKVIVNDTLLHMKEKEIARLKNIISYMESNGADLIIRNKLSVYYLTAVSSDKKNRASKTEFFNIQFQLKGDIASIHEKYLYIEVRDPAHRIISTERDKVRITNHYLSDYKFLPFKYEFIKGKYSIRIYTKDSDFQSVTFLNLL